MDKAEIRQQYNKVFDKPNLHKVLYLPKTKPDEKFSPEKIDKLPYTKSGRAPQLYFDSEFPNFGIRVHPSGKKTYFVRCTKNGKQIYQTLGRTGSMSLKEARSEARRQLYAIRNHLSPAPPKGTFSKAKNNVPAAQPLPKVDENTLTLRYAWSEYKCRRDLKPATVADYEKRLLCYMQDWLDLPMLKITKNDILARHTFLSVNHGHATANVTMRVARAIFSFALQLYDNDEGIPILKFNPLSVLSAARCWNKVKPRRSIIQSHQLAQWWQAVENLSNATARDYLLFTLLTGLRRNEAASLKWENVDLVGKTISIVNPKNHEDHLLPLSEFLLELLISRKSTAKSIYVFPATKSNDKFIDSYSAFKYQVAIESKVDFIVHDLRRTFATTADDIGIEKHVIKRLLNHKTGDITDRYMVPSVDRLREPMQRITDRVLKLADVGQPGQNKDEIFRLL